MPTACSPIVRRVPALVLGGAERVGGDEAAVGRGDVDLVARLGERPVGVGQLRPPEAGGPAGDGGPGRIGHDGEDAVKPSVVVIGCHDVLLCSSLWARPDLPITKRCAGHRFTPCNYRGRLRRVWPEAGSVGSSRVRAPGCASPAAARAARPGSPACPDRMVPSYETVIQAGCTVKHLW